MNLSKMGAAIQPPASFPFIIPHTSGIGGNAGLCGLHLIVIRNGRSLPDK